MPRGLHEELAQASDRNGVSLNQFITGVLAGAVGWRREDAARAAGEEIPVPRNTSRRLSVLLALNLVVVGAAAIAAIAFLVAAWLT
jgi:hypothetical protein